MLDDKVIIAVALGYLGLLFAIAHFGDRRADARRSIISNPYTYTLSIAVYCTGWTFYGSVGRAVTAGVGFLPIYLGPTLMAALWWLVLRKIVRIAKVHRITSIADFVGSRYGKSTLLAGLVTVVAVVGILPYISLQLKAISISFDVLRSYPVVVMPARPESVPLWADTALWVAMLLALFSVLFGTRHIDATERHEGMVAAIAFESVIKLVAFLVVGVVVTFWLFDGPADLFGQAAARPDIARLLTADAIPGGATSWFALTLLAMVAIMFLPRQFQVAVVENVNEEHVRTAAWLFPLYLLAINLFVLPIAVAGLLLLPSGNVDPDTFVLTVPMTAHLQWVALFAFVGGLSAATGMVIVETIALSTMVSNDLLMPVLLRLRSLRLTERRDLSGLLIAIRRGTIGLVLLLGYLYYRLIGESFALVTIGLVSFAAAAQFAPAILIGIYWRGASRRGAAAGLLAGFAIWAYTLLLPAFAKSAWLPMDFVEQGMFGIAALKPYALLGLDGLDPISHSVFWSLLANVGLLVGISVLDRQSTIEQVQAALFVDVFRQPIRGEEAQFWRGTATLADLHALCARFLGPIRADQVFRGYAAERGVELKSEFQADPALVNRVEHLLAGAIGAASARVMVSSIVKGEALSLAGVMQILDETSQVVEYSHRLEQKSLELERTSRELRAANERLKELDRLKDEFVATVSHELRTPLTSVRAFSEILRDNPDVDPAKRQEFLAIIVREAERLTRLINEVLDLAKIESGSMEWGMQRVDVRDLVQEAEDSVRQLFEDSEVWLGHVLPDTPLWLNGDRDRLVQVLLNLLSNAGRFCEPGVGRVCITAAASGGGIRVEVADNGPGVPPEHLERIFEKFHQVTDTQRGKPEGSGLGLAISYRIIAHHGGRIWANSQVGRGTTVSFEIPEHNQSSVANGVNAPATDAEDRLDVN